MNRKQLALRALLACALLAGIQVLAATVVLIQLAVLVAVLATRMWPLAALSALTVPPVATLAYGLVFGRQAAPVTQPRIVLEPEEQPELWALVLDLSGRLRTEPPAELGLIADVNACSSEDSRLLGLIGGPRTVDVGLPLLLGLTRSELQAVLCHELGHFAGRHTRLLAVSHRGHTALNRTGRYLEFLRNDRTTVKPVVRLLGALMNAYTALYERLTFAVRRQQELEADRAAAGIPGGAQALADALRAIEFLKPAWAAFSAERAEREPHTAEGSFEGFAQRLADGTLRSRTVVPEPAVFSFRDTHPPLVARLEALAAAGHPTDLPGVLTPVPSAAGPSAEPAADILRNVPQLAADLDRALRPAGAVYGPAAGPTFSVPPPKRISWAFVRFHLKTALIAMFLILAAGFYFHGVVSPPSPPPYVYAPPPYTPAPYTPTYAPPIIPVPGISSPPHLSMVPSPIPD